MFAKIGRSLVFCLGMMLLIWGIYMPFVALFGTQGQGKITHVRRQGGDRAEAIRNRYTYMISYTFMLPSGELVTGHTQRVGDYFSPKHLVVGKRVEVRYFSFLPSAAVVDRSWGGVTENILVAAVGAVLMYLLGFQRKRTKKRKGTSHPTRNGDQNS